MVVGHDARQREPVPSAGGATVTNGALIHYCEAVQNVLAFVPFICMRHMLFKDGYGRCGFLLAPIALVSFSLLRRCSLRSPWARRIAHRPFPGQYGGRSALGSSRLGCFVCR